MVSYLFIKKRMILDIFKIPVYTVQLSLNNEVLIKFCYDTQKNDTGRMVSNRGGYQSNNLMGLNIPIQPLLNEINTHSSLFAKSLMFKNTNIMCSSIWFNINGHKDYNTSHNHPHCLISGVYYAKSLNSCGLIEFNRNESSFEYDWHDSKMKDLNSYNCTSWRLPTTTNTLYLFPSWLKHCVLPNEHKNMDRISFAFNCN